MKQSFTNSLAVRFLFTTIFFLTIAMGVGTLISSLITDRAMGEVARTELKRQVEDSIRFIEIWLEAQRVQIRSLTNEQVYLTALQDSVYGRSARHAVDQRFAIMALASPFLHSLNLLDLNGKVLVSDLPDEDAAEIIIDKELLRRAIHGEQVISTIFRSSFDGSHIFAMYVSISDISGPLGALYFEYSLPVFNKLFIANLKTGKSGYAFLLDQENKIVAQPDKAFQDTNFFTAHDLVALREHPDSNFIQFIHAGIKTIAYPGSITDLGCVLVLSIPSSELQAPARQLVQASTLITLIAIILTSIGLYLLWRREIFRPIQELIRGITDFSNGKLLQPLAPQSRNEFKSVADSFNTMARSIRKSTVSINELKVQQTNLQTILDSMNIGVLIVDYSEHVEMINSTFISLIGGDTSNKDDIDQIFANTIKPEILQNFSHCPQLEAEYCNPDGKIFYLLRLTQPVTLSGEHMLLATYVDITEQKKSEKERQLLEQDLLAASRLKAIGTLAAGIAHEINTPIQYVSDNVRFTREGVEGLLQFINLLKSIVASSETSAATTDQLIQLRTFEEDIDAEFLQKEIPLALEQSLSGLQHISRIVLAMKTFSHHGEDKVSSYDVNAGLSNTITISRNEWKAVAEIHTDFDSNLPNPLCFIGDMNQVLLNLIINAAQAIGEKRGENATERGNIFIRTSAEKDWVCIAITDDGVGMTTATQSRIFEPFFTTKEIGKGTGQGLSLSQRIVVEKHHGQLLVKSEPGRGTTMIVKLPL
jgi:signal transduction histidine kinase/HAMP domain-containing protein